MKCISKSGFLIASLWAVRGAAEEAPVSSETSSGGSSDPEGTPRVDAALDSEVKPTEAPAPPAKLGLSPPEVLEETAPAYPEVPVAERIERDVVLRVTVGVEGIASSVEIVEGAGEPFDTRAVEATKLVKFRPAARDGVPIAARVLYRVHFAVPPPSIESEVAPVVETYPVAASGSDAKAAETNPPAPVEIEVRGHLSETQRLEKSADAVTVVRLEDAKKRSADMGEVLAKTPGVVVRRAGGLGSDVRFSLNGLYGASVPFFIDSVPLWMTGYPENVSAIPVNLVHHVEIYRGVVPLRLSADALGGALNFVTDKDYETRASASYQVGSFGLQRGTGLAQWRHESSGFVARASGYVDTTNNDYEIDVQVPSEQGVLTNARVKRFHDRYSAYGVNVELGFVGKKWAKKLILRGFHSSSAKELQNNTTMKVPYGEVHYGDVGAGAHLLYEQDLSDALSLQLIGVYANRTVTYVDTSEWVYNWYGERVNPRPSPGEVDGDAADQTTWRNAGFGRVLLEWVPTPNHIFQVSGSPTYATQTGDERRQSDPTARDPLTALRNTFSVVTGLGYELNAAPNADAPTVPKKRQRGSDYRFQNIINLKSYFFGLDSEEPLPGGVFRRRTRDKSLFGISNGVRFGLAEHFHVKASYEYAARIPFPYEIFGDGVLVKANLELDPETSHNLNLGPLFDAKRTRTGDWVAGLDGFYRDSNDMIVLLGNDRNYAYQNVYRALTVGASAFLSWVGPKKIVSVDGQVTKFASINMSEAGSFADFRGDRIPNRPDFMGSWGVRFHVARIFFERDALEPYYQGRFTDAFFRGWESQGLIQFKQKVAAQVAHGAGITYQWASDFVRLAGTFEVENLTDAALFDDFGVQRPGRGYYFKLTGDI